MVDIWHAISSFIVVYEWMFLLCLDRDISETTEKSWWLFVTGVLEELPDRVWLRQDVGNKRNGI
jgi:hypothetical protein